MFTAAGLHNQEIYIFLNEYFCATYQVTKEIPVFSVKVLAPLDYLAHRALKESGVSERSRIQMTIVKTNWGCELKVFFAGDLSALNI